MEQKQKKGGLQIYFPGLISVIAFFLFGVVCLIIGGINYSTLYTKWADGPWKALAPIELAVTIYLIVIAFIGAGVFTVARKEKMFITVFLILLLISLLFSWSIGIFASIGGTIYHKVDHTLGCNSELTGVLEMWNNIDTYLQYADSLHCSDQCQCQMFSDVLNDFNSDPFAKVQAKTWNVRTVERPEHHNQEKNYKFTFKHCSSSVQNEAHNKYMENPLSAKYPIKMDKFADYWEDFEKRFDCVGWCKTNYVDPYTLNRRVMHKYVFSDINRGVPKYIGCLHRITNWLPGLVGAFGGCLIVSAFLQTLTWIFALKLLFEPIDDQYKGKQVVPAEKS